MTGGTSNAGPEGLMNLWRVGRIARGGKKDEVLGEGGKDGAAFGGTQGVEGGEDVSLTEDIHVVELSVRKNL